MTKPNKCTHEYLVYRTDKNISYQTCSICGDIELIMVDCAECGALIAMREKEYIEQNGKYYHYTCLYGNESE